MPHEIMGPNPTGTPELEAVKERMRAEITLGHNPTATLAVVEHQILLALCYHNEFGANIVVDQLRHFAAHELSVDVRWSEREAERGISFKVYKDGARTYRESVAEARRAGNVYDLEIRRAMRNATTNAAALVSLNPADMMRTGSLRMRAVGLLRQQRQGRIWFDAFANQFKTDWNGTSDGATIAPHAMEDEFYHHVALWFAQDDKLGNITMRMVIECCHTAAWLDKRNAPKDWLNSLTWDGNERLTDVFPRGYGAEPSEFNINAGRCWFVSMVARVMRPGCQLDTMPVLIGPQGIYKTQSLRIIGGEWYQSASAAIHSKDFLQELWGVLVFEIQELHSLVTSNAAAAKVKSVISTQVDHFRKSYGYAPTEFRRTACMVGTTNYRDWHHDESGARRFWPIHCGAIDLEWIRLNRDQLFAEAVAYFNLPALVIPLEGDNTISQPDPRSLWWNVPHAAQVELMEHETAEDVWETAIAYRLELGRDTIWRGESHIAIEPHDGTYSETTNWGNLLTSQRLAMEWLRLNSEQASRRVTANRIGSIMRRIGWRRVQQRIPGSNLRGWIWLPPEPPISPVVMPEAPSVPEEEDIPF